MQAKIPVLAVTDPNTDIGKDIVEGGFGWWCESDDVESVIESVQNIIIDNLSKMGDNAYQYLIQNFDVKYVYNIVK